jgi:hypothetical protein
MTHESLSEILEEDSETKVPKGGPDERMGRSEVAVILCVDLPTPPSLEVGQCCKIDRILVSAQQGVASRASRASPAKQGEHQEYIDVLSSLDSPYRISSASIKYMHTCLLRATGKNI